MAGDHKCPVCQATFTRPQHVARHMRSHTGDRPYKCQHCGDQFARSDLLNRHVNKCHAGDKPPITTAPTRRKGQHGSSSTRATTSKQACDQCVMETLPCDGANPCSKCSQRTNPCTYVKFQRQTAPSGPGHKHSHSSESASSSSSSLSTSVPHPDELFLVPPPMTVPTMTSTGETYYSTSQFAFNPPPGAHSWESDSPKPPSLSLSVATDSGHDSSSPDLAAHFRNPDILRTLVPSSFAPGASGPGLIPSPTSNLNAYYNALQQQPTAPPDPWHLPADYNLTMQHRKMEDGFAQYLPPGTSSSISGPASILNPSNLDFHGNNFYNLQTRRGSIDQCSDNGSNASAPSSAASSSVHLPLDFGMVDSPQQQQMHQIHAQNVLPYSPYDDAQPAPPSREGRFTTSFEMMSLTDEDGRFKANVANMEGNAPFFTQHAMKMPPQDSTPRPSHNQQATSTNDREAEMRELRDFWKQILRTPLTGPSYGQTPKAEQLNRQLGGAEPHRPAPKRGLSRVASLPTVRTPPEEKTNPPSRSNVSNENHSTMQATDDLKSYEEAVLARKPLSLNFVPRKGRLSLSTSSSPQPMPELHYDSAPSITYQSIGPLDDGNMSDDNPPLSASSQRPSFKRLPSQTLENSIQKRALFCWAGNDNAIEDTDSDADAPIGGTDSADRTGGMHGSNSTASQCYHRSMQIAHSETYLERFRRQSAPTSIRPPLGDDSYIATVQNDSPSPNSYASDAVQSNYLSNHIPHGEVQSGMSGSSQHFKGNSLVQSMS